MATINLAPGTQYLATQRRRRTMLFGLSAGIVVTVGAVWIILFLLVQQQRDALAAAEQELAAAERKIAEAGPDVERITFFEDRLQAVDQLISSHVAITPLFKELERLMPTTTALTHVDMDTERGNIDVTGVTPTMDEIAQALASLSTSVGRATLFPSAELSGVTRVEKKTEDGLGTITEYQFTAKLPFNKSALFTFGK